LPKDYFGRLLNVVEETVNDDAIFNKAKQQSLKTMESLRQETIGVILLSLYLTVIAVIDCVEMESEAEVYYN